MGTTRAALRMAPDEQRWARRMAVGGAILFVLLFQPAAADARGARLALAGIGVAFCALLYFAAWRGSRVFAGLAAFLVAFGPWSFAWILGLPYLVLATWMAMRARRAIKATAAAPPEPPAPPLPKADVRTGRVTPKKAKALPPAERRRAQKDARRLRREGPSAGS
ncbi:MAG: hypothetical protein ACRD0F_04110 [Acidimicrobiales bacterium]